LRHKVTHLELTRLGVNLELRESSTDVVTNVNARLRLKKIWNETNGNRSEKILALLNDYIGSGDFVSLVVSFFEPKKYHTQAVTHLRNEFKLNQLN
jgi:hypothetical protein